MNIKKTLAVLAIAACFSQAWSQEVIEDATSQELLERLAPTAPATRSLRNLQVKPKSVDLTINFDFDSAKVRAESLPLLQNLAEALKSERLAEQKFAVEGHTDGKGKAAYNLSLSQRRASSVREYLISQGVDGERIEAVGKGADELLFPEEPARAENRRVRVGIR